MQQTMSVNAAGCWSECETLTCVALCPPAPIAVETQFEAEMINFRTTFDPWKAQAEFDRLQEALQAGGVEIVNLYEHMTDEERLLSDRLANRIYVRDIAAVLGTTVFLGTAGCGIRQPEFEIAHNSLRRILPQNTIAESAELCAGLEFGDFLILNRNALLINAGNRTDLAGMERLCMQLGECGFEEFGLIALPQDIRTAHLDLACGVIGRRTFIGASFLRHLPLRLKTAHQSARWTTLPDFVHRHGFDMLELPPESDGRGYTNFINLDERTLLTSTTAEHLPCLIDNRHTTIISINIAELEKGGGGIRCMTLPLARG